jgi:hypothetical protein
LHAGAHPDVGALALAAADDAGEEEVGGVPAPACHVLAAFGEQRLCSLECVLVE